MVRGCWWQVLTLTLFHHLALSRSESSADSSPKEGVRCYICINVSDNRVCNRFAIDRPCPQDKDFCHTLHIMDSSGRSVVVHKKCADLQECAPDRVGCLEVDRQRLCVSCCDQPYCNRLVPTNYTNALYYARRRHRNSTNRGQSQLTSEGEGTVVMIMVLMIACLTTLLNTTS